MKLIGSSGGAGGCAIRTASELFKSGKLCKPAMLASGEIPAEAFLMPGGVPPLEISVLFDDSLAVTGKPSSITEP